MKNILSFLPILMLMLCLICCQNPTNTMPPIVQQQYDSLSIELTVQSVEEDDTLTKIQRPDEPELSTSLSELYLLIKENLKSDKFSTNHQWSYPDNIGFIKSEVLVDKVFVTQQKYLFLRRYAPFAVYDDIYKIVEDTVENVIAHTQDPSSSYIRDTIFDANGDTYLDFLVHYYPVSGCCRRNFYVVYLNIASEGEFSEGYEFINPTFSPQEGIIRGVEYGHSGEVGLYKYKWNGLAVDTIEYIYPDAAKKGRFIKTTHSTYIHTDKEGIVLPAVPEEYHNIDDYDWFSFDLE